MDEIRIKPDIIDNARIEKIEVEISKIRNELLDKKPKLFCKTCNFEIYYDRLLSKFIHIEYHDIKSSLFNEQKLLTCKFCNREIYYNLFFDTYSHFDHEAVYNEE